MLSNNASTGCTGLANCRADWSAWGFLAAEGQEMSGGAGCQMIGVATVIPATNAMRLRAIFTGLLHHIKPSFHSVSVVQWPRRLKVPPG